MDTNKPEEAQTPLTKETTPKPGESKDDDEEEAYPPELLNNLIFRYEEPSTHSRWDKPLFTVPWSDPEPPVADIFQALSGIVLASDETPTESPVANLTQSLASSTLSDIASTTTTGRAFNRGQSTRPKIIPHQATVQAVATDSGALYAMEKRTTAVVNAIRAFTQANPSAEMALAQSTHQKGIAIEIPDVSIPVIIPSHVATTGTTDELAGAGGLLALPKLQRMRRQWISLNRRYIGHGHGTGQGSLAPERVGDAFVRFLNHEFEGVENTHV